MKKEIADKWVAALRSGEYVQGKDHLSINDAYCCLGVLCELAIKDGIRINKEMLNGVMSYNNFVNVPPYQVREWAEINYINNSSFPESFDRLTTMNDVENKTFAEIADYIEQNYENI